PDWPIAEPVGADEVVRTAREDLSDFFENVAKIKIRSTPDAAAHSIQLIVNAEVEGVNTAEGFRVEVSPDRVSVSAMTSRGVMRGVYWLEEAIRGRRASLLKTGVTVRNARFARRITTTVHPGGDIYTESSRPLVYTDGVLQRISHDGFNAIFLWGNAEEVTMDSKIFPDLNDP